MFLYTMITIVIAVPVFIYSILKTFSMIFQIGRDFVVENLIEGKRKRIVILALVVILLFGF